MKIGKKWSKLMKIGLGRYLANFRKFFGKAIVSL